MRDRLNNDQSDARAHKNYLSLRPSIATENVTVKQLKRRKSLVEQNFVWSVYCLCEGPFVIQD